MPLSRKPIFFPSSSCVMDAPIGMMKQNEGGNNNNNNYYYYYNNIVEVRRLTRQRKLRHLNNQEVFGLLHLHSTVYCSCNCSSSSSSSPESCKHSSHGGCGSHWSFSAVPQPLPLPDSQLSRRPVESTGLSPGHAHQGSSSLEHPNFGLRKIVNHGAMKNTSPSSNLDRPSLDPTVAKAKHNLRVHIPAKSFLAGNSSCKNPTSVPYDDDDDSESISGLSLRVAAKSAPSSVFTSPLTSPRGSTNVVFFDHTINFLQEVNGNLKHLPAKSVHKDHSLTCCPASLSAYYNPKIQEGSHQHHKFLSTVWPENNHVDAHPLPLPPRVSSPLVQAPLQHHSSTMHHVTDNQPSMKGQWQKGKLIGRGTFGSVYHATNLETGASCAMKEVDLFPDDPTSAECIKQLEQEIRILRQLHHPNIVQYYGSEIVGDHLYIYMEYVHPGSVNKFIREHCGAMTESVVRNFTRHILSGLAYFHSTKTIHRDIKGANLLVNESGIVKLADFGMAKILSGNSCQLSLKGSPYWMAPEVMKAAIKNESNPDLAMAIDIWSLGCTIIEMLTGKPPWSEFEGPSAMFKVLYNTPPIPETLSSVGKDFLQQCFRRDPADRPPAAMLLKHAFVQNFHDQDVLVHPQLFPRGDPGQGDNSPIPRDTTKNRCDVMPASMSVRIFNKIQKSMGESSQHYNAEESKQIIPSRHSHVPEFLSLQSSLKPGGTLNYLSVANSSNIPLTHAPLKHVIS